MLTGVFKDRSAKDRVASDEQALAELLAARELRNFPLTRHCEIGPFVVEFLFPEQSLIVESMPSAALDDDSPAARRKVARAKFLSNMGYAVFGIDSRERARQPRRVLVRLLKELRNKELTGRETARS
jgi:very-short-patch-repair endonuclease